MVQQSADNGKTFAVLAYFIFFLPLLAAKDSKLAMFHANQSLILVLIWVVTAVAGAVIPAVGGIISLVGGIGAFILWIMGIINAANGEMKPLPLVGNFTLLK